MTKLRNIAVKLKIAHVIKAKKDYEEHIFICEECHRFRPQCICLTQEEDEV